MKNEKCNTCSEPTKRPVGFWDGRDGSHGCLYSCQNEMCEAFQMKRTEEMEINLKRQRIRELNMENGIDIKQLVALRKNKKKSMRKMAELVHCSPAEYSSYEHEREAFPLELYKKCMEHLYKNHDSFLQDLRMETLTGQFSRMTSLALDNFLFSFVQPLTLEQQIAVTDFMGNSKELNSLTPVDFCIFFLKNKIEFSLSWTACKEITGIGAIKNAILIEKINQIRERNGL